MLKLIKVNLEKENTIMVILLKVWVVGDVERTIDRKVFLVVVPSRNREVLKLVIDTYIKNGSHIYVDCWRGYNVIYPHPERDIIVKTVNHCENYVDPITQAYTNTIEGKI